MTLEEFIKKYIGQKVDYDKYAGFQCTDLFRQYCADVVQCPHTGAVEGAKDLWFNFSENDEKKYFVRKSIYGLKAGDVVIWDETATNPYGHVAIAIDKPSGGYVKVVEQDGFKQDGVKFVNRSLKNALGILRIKEA